MAILLFCTFQKDGDPSTAFPLAECEGDCDTDTDCRDNLICYQRMASDRSVPGCNGEPSAGDESDYCIQPPTVL